MRLAIICAMEEELVSIIELLALKEVITTNHAGTNYLQCVCGGHQLILVVSGIGKVNAAIRTQIICDNFKLDGIINVGVAGSLVNELNFGDIVVASDLVEHDVDASAFGLALGQIPRLDTFAFKVDDKLQQQLYNAALQLTPTKVAKGRIISGDQFIDDAKKVKFLQQEFNALACEMEGAAIAHVCYLNQMPFAVLRSLSDMAGVDGIAKHSFEEFKIMAAKQTALVIKYFMDGL